MKRSLIFREKMPESAVKEKAKILTPHPLCYVLAVVGVDLMIELLSCQLCKDGVKSCECIRIQTLKDEKMRRRKNTS